MKIRDALELLKTMNPDADLVVGAVAGEDGGFAPVPVFGFLPDTTTGRPSVVLVPESELKHRHPRL